MKKKIFVLIALSTIISCSGPDVEITREYISNTDWKDIKSRRAGFSIYELIIPDTIVRNPNLDAFEFERINSSYDINYKNSFSCLSYKEFDLSSLSKDDLTKIFFDKEQKGIYWSPYELGRDYHTRTKLSKLALDSWYRFDGLRSYWTFYAYVDKEGKVYLFHTKQNSFGV